MAPRPLPRLRRGRRLLGAGRHGAHARCRIGEEEEPASARQKLAATLHEHLLDPEERSFVEPRLAHLLGLEESSGDDRAGPVRGLAALLRAPGRRLPDRARLRGHAVGGHEPARLRRVPARVVARLPAVRDHAGPPGVARAPPDLGRRPAQLQLPLPGAALAGGDAGAARGARARPARRPARARSSPAPRASRSTRSRRCGCCSTAASSSRRARSTGRRARSARSRCPRRCTR